MSTHDWSQPVSQHEGNRLQTMLQQVTSSQPGVAWTTLQAPALPQFAEPWVKVRSRLPVPVAPSGVGLPP